jgi:mono/diheme cytochrome c family protein
LFRALGGAILPAALIGLAACAPETIQDHMQEHFAQVSEVHTAVVGGKLDAAKEAAAWLADHGAFEELPGDWEPHVTAMQTAAQQIVDANDLAAAAAGTAEMGRACGTCHMSLDEGGQFTVVELPVEESGVVAHMLRHEWATNRLWEGIIGPSDELWLAGAEGLEESPLRPQGAAQEVTDWANRIHEVGLEAKDAQDLETRASLYADVLGSCAGCHNALGRGPAATPFGR